MREIKKIVCHMSGHEIRTESRGWLHTIEKLQHYYGKSRVQPVIIPESQAS